MRRSKYVLGLIFILIASFIITSCSESDKEENDNQLSDAALPLLGYWLLQEETDDYYYCSMLTFTKDCFYQVREQYKNETEGNLGTFSFDDRTNVITFNPTKDFSDEDLVNLHYGDDCVKLMLCLRIACIHVLSVKALPEPPLEVVCLHAAFLPLPNETKGNDYLRFASEDYR